MSEQPQRRRRRRRNRRPVERQTAPPDGGESAAEASGEESSEGGSDSSSQEVRSEGGRARGRGGGTRSGGRAQEQPRKRTIFGLPRMSFAILAGLLVALIAMVVMQQLFPPSNVTEIRGLLAYPDQGRRHLAEGETFDTYNSSPPTSGPHHDEMPAVGVYGADEDAPFNQIPEPVRMLPLLESGGVVVYYDPASAVADDLLTWLRLLAGNRPYLAALPIAGLTEMHDAPIVAAAWRTLLPIAGPSADDEADEEDGQPAWRAQLEVFLSSGESGYYERYVLDRDGQRQLLEEARRE